MGCHVEFYDAEIETRLKHNLAVCWGLVIKTCINIFTTNGVLGVLLQKNQILIEFVTMCVHHTLKRLFRDECSVALSKSAYKPELIQHNELIMGFKQLLNRLNLFKKQAIFTSGI